MKRRIIIALAMAIWVGVGLSSTGCATPKYSGYDQGIYHSRGPSIHAESFPTMRSDPGGMHFGRPYGRSAW